MSQSRKTSLLLITIIFCMVGAAIGLRQVAATADWAPLFDIAALLGVVGLSLQWESEAEPTEG